jgi:hypothetical protein
MVAFSAADDDDDDDDDSNNYLRTMTIASFFRVKKLKKKRPRSKDGF